MEPQVSELPDSRVKVEVEVAAADVERAVNRAARTLAREMRMPGFRKGKAPPSLVIQRVGFAAVLEEAIREALPDWYERALLGSGIVPVGDPTIEVASTPEGPGEPLAFEFEIGVRPKAQLGEYMGLEVGKAEPEAPDEAVEREVERIRESFARLEPVERAAAEGDALLIDFEGLVDGQAFQGGTATDYLLELGSGQLIEGFEEQLSGVRAGESREVEVSFPEDYRAEELAGNDAVFRVEVKEVREKVLPDLDDDFAAEASEFDTLEELRADIGKRLAEVVSERIEQDFRVAVVDAAAERAKVELPEELATARATERWERVERQLAARGMSPDAYLQMQGKTREEAIEESKGDAEAELKREAVLAAIAEAEELDASEEEMVEALEHTAEHERTTPEKLLQRLRENGRDAMVREDIRIRKAIDLVADSAKPIPLEQAEAREKIWTPEKEREEAGSLWTPGSDT
ncbi:MAG TPA: trigger factor [Solirubrobacterales bacterium]|jgi:trigger factor|nr:trigger factor [Solirubrobacterales bacterium]